VAFPNQNHLTVIKKYSVLGVLTTIIPAPTLISIAGFNCENSTKHWRALYFWIAPVALTAYNSRCSGFLSGTAFSVSH
jgi:hypothetical protein